MFNGIGTSDKVSMIGNIFNESVCMKLCE
jgi:hypothetical protein